MRLRLVLPVLLIAPLLAQCMAASDPVRTSAVPAKTSVTTKDAYAAATLISRYRAQHGLGPVTVGPRLNDAAVAQARAIAGAPTLSHGAFAERVRSFGIRGEAAENLTAGSQTVEHAIERWKASSGHNENLLLPAVRQIGIAHAHSPGAGWDHYWALVLAQ
jgi:uncharacterized protein YkwD